MGCKTFGVSQMLVDLHRVGVVGLKEALSRVAASDTGGDRETIVDRLVELLTADNFIPEGQSDSYRTALWREYLRYRGEDFSHLYSAVEVTVRGEPGEELDRFVALVDDVFREFELTPVITYAPPQEPGRYPQLLAGETVIVRGLASRPHLKTAVRRSFTDW